MSNIIKVLEKERTRLGITKKCIYEGIGISRQSFDNKLRGEEKFNHKQLEEFAEIVGCEIALIVKGDAKQ